MSTAEVRAGQRWAARNGGDPDIQIAGRATRFDGWCGTWSGGPRGGERWPTTAILDEYVLAAEFRRAGTG